MKPHKTIGGAERMEVRVPYILRRDDVLNLIAGHYCADIHLGDAGYMGHTVPSPTIREMETAIRERLYRVGESWWSWDENVDESEVERARGLAEVWLSRIWPRPDAEGPQT